MSPTKLRSSEGTGPRVLVQGVFLCTVSVATTETISIQPFKGREVGGEQGRRGGREGGKGRGRGRGKISGV